MKIAGGQTGREERRLRDGGRAPTCQAREGFLFARLSRRLKPRMPVPRRHLKIVTDEAPEVPEAIRACRTRGCALPRASVLGFCAFCQAVYDAARELHSRRVEWCWARIEDAWRPLIGTLTNERRTRLRAHLAAHAAQPGGVSMRAIEDFLADLHELGDREGRR